MKKAMIVCALCLLALFAFSACSLTEAAVSSPAPTETAPPTETPAPTPEPTSEPTPEPTPDPLYEPYRELVTQVSLGLERGWVADLVTERGISEVFKTAEKGVFGWLQEDINHDGVDELLFGKLTAADEASPFYDIYTMLAGEMVHLSTGWDYNHWYLLADGLFVNEWHGAEYETYRTAYGLFNGKFIPANRYVEADEYIHIDFLSFEDLPWQKP